MLLCHNTSPDAVLTRILSGYEYRTICLRVNWGFAVSENRAGLKNLIVFNHSAGFQTNNLIYEGVVLFPRSQEP